MFGRKSQIRIGNWPPEIAVSSWSVRTLISGGELSILNFPRFAKEQFSVGHIEIVVNHLIADSESDFKALADAASTESVKIVCLAVSNDFTVSNRELDVEVDETMKMLQRAKQLGAPVVRLNPGLRGHGTPDAITQRVVSGLKRVLSAAENLQLVLALENHQLFGMTPENILKVLEYVDASDRLGVCLDFGNFFPEHLNTGPRLLASRTVHAHAKAYQFDENGNETTIDYAGRLRELREAGFKGYISIEWEGAGDEIKNTNRAIKLIKKCLKELK